MSYTQQLKLGLIATTWLAACGGSQGTSINMEFTGPDLDGTLSFEIGEAQRLTGSFLVGRVTLNAILQVDERVSAKENPTAKCAQASLFADVTAVGEYGGDKFTFTTSVDPDGNVNARALRSKDQPGKLVISVFNDTRIEGSFETQLERTNSQEMPSPKYQVKARFGIDRKPK